MTDCNSNNISYNNPQVAIFNLGGRQLPPSPLPDVIPATAVAFTFENNSCAIAIFDGLNCSEKSVTVDEALNTINDYFCCFPSNLCDAENTDILIFNGNNKRYEVKKFGIALLDALNELIGKDEYLTNAGGGVVAANFCKSVGDCIESFLINDNHVLTLDGGILSSILLDDLIKDFMAGFLAPGHIFIGGAGGDVLSRSLCDEVCKCLVLPPGNFWFGGTTGGLFKTPFCPEVMKCLDDEIKQDGDIFIGGAGGALEVRQIDDVMTDVLSLLLGNNQILIGGSAGVRVMNFCNAITATNCLGSGQFWFNNGNGTAIHNFCDAVMGCIDDFLGVNEIIFGGVPVNLCSAMVMAGCFSGSDGEIYINDGGNLPSSTGLLAYLNTYHNAGLFPDKTCDDFPTALAYDPKIGSWSYVNFLTSKPSETEKQLYSPPTLRTDKAKMTIEYKNDGQCAGWTASPRQYNYSIIVPGDFPNLASALEFLNGRTIEQVAIDVQQQEPNGVSIKGFNGRLYLNMNGNILGGIANESTTSEVTLANAQVTGGVTATNNAVVLIDNGVTSNGHAGDGFAANHGGTIRFYGNATANNNGNAGFRARNGGYIFIAGDAVTSGNRIGMLANTNGTITVMGRILASNSVENGVVSVENSVIVAENDIISNDNGFDGVVAGNHSLLKGREILVNGNGRSGVRVRVNSSITSFVDTRATNNVQHGIIINENSSLSADGTIQVIDSQDTNIIVEEHSAMNSFGSTLSSGSGGVGIKVSQNSHIYAELSIESTNNAKNGIVVNFNSNIVSLTVITSNFNGGTGLISAINSSVSAQEGATFSNNGLWGVQTFDCATTLAFNATIEANVLGGTETVANSVITLYNSTVLNNGGFDMEARESSFNRVFTPYGSTVGAFSPPQAGGNFGSYTI